MIVVIGSINMDLVLRVPRMPLRGETLTGGAFRTIPGGKGANQAVACARLGRTPVAMVGCVGDDAFGTTLRAALAEDGVDVGHVAVLPGVATGVASILVDDDGQNSIVIAGGANDRLTPAHIDAALPLMARAGIVVVQLETPLDTVRHAIAMAHGMGKTVVLNPAPAAGLPAGVLAQVDYLVPNEIEAAMLLGADAAAEDYAGSAAALQAKGCRNVLVTLGARGVHAALADGTSDFPARAVKAVDTTAAGDTFIGAIDLGQRAAAIGVTRHGAQTSIPYLNELEPS